MSDEGKRSESTRAFLCGTDDNRRLEQLLAGLDRLDQGITVFDADLLLVAWNEPFLRLLDFPAELAFVGASFDSFIRYNARRGEYGPGDPEAQVAERVALARDFAPHETVRERPNGLVLSIRGEPLPHKGFVTLYSDITEQRFLEHFMQHQNEDLEERVRRRTAQLENTNAKLRRALDENARFANALRRSEERLRLITDTIPAMIGYFDREGVYRYANKGYSEWFGVPESRFTGHSIQSAVPPAVWDAVRAPIERALTGRQVSFEYAMEKDGRTVFARSTLVPEMGPDGEAIGCFVHSFDITEEKRMQAALLQAQKMEAIGQFTGGLAHDFNNLLTVIMGNLAALNDRRGGDAEVKELVEPALQAARRGAQAIRRLLTFSRQQPLEPEATDIGALIAGMARLIRQSLPEAMTVITELPDAPLLALVDPGQLEAALLNFVVNARDAMPENGRLCIRAQAREMDEILAAEQQLPAGHYVKIEVEDSGCGMDPATLARAFEPFFSTKRRGLGSGLGLAMAHNFARQSGGSLRLASTPGAGSTVCLLLPGAVPGSGRDSTEGTNEGTASKPLVLLVDDDEPVRRVVRLQLNELGYPVVEAQSAAEALEMLACLPEIAFLVSDVIMPDMNGVELAERVGEMRPDIRCLLISGYTEGNVGHLPVKLLTKPFTRQELARALARRTG